MHTGNIILGIGAMKAGTTWLHGLLRQHPGVLEFPIKELNLLNEWAGVGDTTLTDRYRAQWSGGDALSPFWKAQGTTCLHALEYWQGGEDFPGKDILVDLTSAYLARSDVMGFYRHVSERIDPFKFIDFSPAYACVDSQAIERFSDTVPDARIILCLREPVGRLISHMGMGFPDPSKAADESAIRDLLSAPEIAPYCLYRHNLENWARHFPAERILLVALSDFRTHGNSVLNAVQEFCGLDPCRPEEAFQNRSESSLIEAISGYFPIFREFILRHAEDVFIPSKLFEIWYSCLMESENWPDYRNRVAAAEDALAPSTAIYSDWPVS